MSERLGDQEGYFMSAAFWADRYRDIVSGKLSSKVREVRVKDDEEEE